MLLKKASMVSVLALAVGVSAVGVASAATVTKASAVQVINSAYIVNGVSVNLSTFFEKGKTLVSVKELSTRLGASLQALKGGIVQAKLNGHLVELKLDSTSIKVDGVEQKLSVPVKAVKGTTYVELKSYVQALGAQFAKDASGATWIDANLLADVDHIQFADPSTIIASLENETGRVDYLINAQTGKYASLLDAADASELVVSPNGVRAAYTKSTGEVYVINLGSKTSSLISADTSIKPELVWSADGSALYFLQGDKGSVIAKLDVTSGTISKILDDKVDYKANLGVSADGKTFTYTVTKPGAVVADANKPVDADDVTIDMKGTEPQIFLFVNDPSIKDNKPTQLTTAADDKVFIQAAADGSSVTYVSVSADDNVKSTLVQVSKDKTVKTLFADKDVYQATLSNGKWYVLTEGNGSNQFIYEIDPATGTAKQIYTVSDSVSEIVVKAGAPFAVINNGHVYVDIDGHWKPTTR
ncbi:hypothetical protein D7Z26_07005 [Cohnella endophytica]|uniref:Copper amine oxidase-like N-terminal domain-containing protein n=1 Tax=Cohnella endophytica TaxID=2419778 RepID=A0A494Y4X8_9BACL|nr:stalk domain-containing protein [Cohnella endophytica]RKP54980.1 hypothetical protein D7Z26_07005 [Cohnella endophytica]